MAGVTLGAHGTYVVSAAATVGARRSADRDRLRVVGARAGDRDGGAARRRRLLRGGRPGRRGRASVRRSIRRPTSTRAPTTAGTSPRCRPSAPSCKQPREQRGERVHDVHEPDDHGRDQRHDLRARRSGVAPARALPPRRPRPHRHPHRLRHGELRRLHRAARRRRGQELLHARRPGRRRVDHDRRGPRGRRGRADAAAAVVPRAPRASSAATARPGC